MRPLLVLFTLCAALGFASEATDRAAIDKLVQALNESPRSPELFAADFDSSAELARVTQNPAFSDSKLDFSRLGETRPAGVVISHEPMGEATFYTSPILMPAVVPAPPRFVVQSVRFIGPDVALVDTLQEHYDLSSRTQRFPVLLVLKREESVWRIASLRVTAR